MAAGIQLGNSIYDGMQRGKERAQNEALTGLAIEQQVIDTARSGVQLQKDRFEFDQVQQSRNFDTLVSMGFIKADGNMMNLDQERFRTAFMDNPSEFKFAANLIANNSNEMALSPSGFQIKDFSMQAKITDPASNEVVGLVPYFKQGSQQQLAEAHKNGMAINTVFAFAGKNADGSDGVLTENGLSGPDAPTLTMDFDEIMSNLEFAYDTGILPRSGKPIAQYAQLQNEIKLAKGAKKKVIEAEIARLDLAQSRRDKIFLLQDYLSKNNNDGGVQQLRALTAAAVAYGNDSPQFTNAVNKIYDDIKVDQEIDNKLIIKSSGEAAKHLNNYKAYKAKYVPGQTTNHPDMDILTESLAAAAPNDELTMMYTDQAGTVSAIASELLPEAITALGKDKMVNQYTTKQARLAGIEKRIADIKEGGSKTMSFALPVGAAGGAPVTYQAPVTKKELEKFEENRRRLLKETDDLKTKLIDKYLISNPDAAGAVDYLSARDKFEDIKINMAQAAQIGNFNDPLQVFEAINDGSLVITQEEMLANANYLNGRDKNIQTLNDVANLPYIRQLQVMANTLMTTDDKERRQTMFDEFRKIVFPGAKTTGFVSANTDKIVSQLGLGKDINTFGAFLTDARDTANKALSTEDMFKEDGDESEGERKRAIRKMFGPQGMLTKLEALINRVGQSDDNFDYGAVQQAQQLQREIISQAFRQFASDTGFFDFEGRSEVEYAGDWADGIVLIGGKLQYIAADGETPVGDPVSVQELRDELKLPKGSADRLLQFARDNAAAKGLI